MENFVFISIISVVSGSNFCPLIGYLNTYSAVVFKSSRLMLRKTP